MKVADLQQIRAALDEDANRHEGVHRCDGGDYWLPEDGPCRPDRAVAALRAILDRHAPLQSGFCDHCLGNEYQESGWPCADVLSVASIYLPGHSAVGGAEGPTKKIIEEG